MNLSRLEWMGVELAAAEALSLRPTERKLLMLLLTRPGQWRSCGDLNDALNLRATVRFNGGGNAHKAVERLRAKLTDVGLRTVIQSEPGRGYRIHPSDAPVILSVISSAFGGLPPLQSVEEREAA